MENESILVSLYNEKKHNTTEPRSWEERFTALDVFLGKVSKNCKILNSPEMYWNAFRKYGIVVQNPSYLVLLWLWDSPKKWFNGGWPRLVTRMSTSTAMMATTSCRTSLPREIHLTNIERLKQNVCTLALDPCSDLYSIYTTKAHEHHHNESRF